MPPLKPASTFAASRTPIVDKDGTANRFFVKVLQDWDTKLSNGLNQIGQITQSIPQATAIVGRVAIGLILQFIGDDGVVLPAGLPAATPANQGAVILPAGALNNTLGSASVQPSTAFDPAGSATAAQTAAQTFATGAANTAQANAQAFATAAVTAAFAPGMNVTITTAKLTVGGANGSMTFSSGLLTAETPAT